MTPLNAALLAFELTALVPVLACCASRLARPRREPRPLPEVCPPDVNPTVVVHEAGHALLAWHCTAVATVLSVNTREGSDVKAEFSVPPPRGGAP